MGIHTLKYSQNIYCSCCNVNAQFAEPGDQQVTCKPSDYRVWTLTNPINFQAQAQLR